MGKQLETFGWKSKVAIVVLILAVFITAMVAVDNGRDASLAKQDALMKAKEAEMAKLAKEAEVKAKLEAEAKAKKVAEDLTKAQAEQAKTQAELSAVKDEVYALRVANNKLPSDEETEVSTKGDVHTEDDLELGSAVPVILLGDTKLKKLFDGEVVFDGDKYDMEESVEFSGLSLPLGNDDYRGESFLEIVESGIKYIIKFESALPTNEISEDETLEFQFLGDKLIVKEWDGNKIVFTSGTEHALKEGESVLVNGKPLIAEFIGENDDVIISYNGVKKELKEGQVKPVGSLDVYVDEVLANSRAGIVTLRVGSDVEETVVDGDEFESDKKWIWVVDESTKTLGLTLDEAFEDKDADEPFNALAYGESFKLPKDRVVMTFLGLDKVDMTKVKMDLATKSGVEYVRVIGEFDKGLESYTKLYVSKNTSQVYGLNEDNDLELLGDRVLINDGEYELLVSNDAVKVVDKGTSIERAKFKKDFSQATLDGSVLTGDENHLSSIGIRVMNVEDSLEDEQFEFSVPEERVFVSLSFQ